FQAPTKDELGVDFSVSISNIPIYRELKICLVSLPGLGPGTRRFCCGVSFVPLCGSALTARPIAAEIQKTCPAVTFPRTLRCPTAANPMDAIQPHREQSGFPPNWQGSTIVRKSADNESVV